MRRRLLNLLTALSLVLFCATAAACVRSFFVGDRVARSRFWIEPWPGGATTRERYLAAESGGGVLHLSVFNNVTPHAKTPEQVEEPRRAGPQYYGGGVVRWRHDTYHPPKSLPTGVSNTFAGFGYTKISVRAGLQVSRHLAVPWAFPAACFVAAPALRARRWSRDRRRRESDCRQCGYDLTGNVSGVCPECGARTAATGATE